MLLSQAASDLSEAMSRTVTVPTILNAMQKLYSEGCGNLHGGIQRDEMLLGFSLAMQTVFALLSRAVPSEQGHTGGSSNNKKSSVGLDNEAQAPLVSDGLIGVFTI